MTTSVVKAALITSYLSRTGGGVATAIEALSRHLREVHTDVHVIGMRDDKWLTDEANWNGAPVTALPRCGPEAMAYAPSALSRLHDLNPSITHTHGIWTYPSHVVSAWSASTRRPYVVSPHGMLDPWAMSRGCWKKKIAAWLYENAHLRRANCLHALCDAEAKSIRNLGFINPMCVIPNGISLPRVQCDTASPWSKIIRDDANVMLFLGRLHSKKNLTALLDVWPRKPEYDNWHLVIAGWNQACQQELLADTIERRGLGKKVHLIGPLFGLEKDAAFRHARAFVLPSLSEGLPMAVLEAWSYGLPVLMTDACNLPEGFSAGAAMRMSLEPHQMHRDLLHFLNQERIELEQMGRNGRQLVEARFNWPSVAIQMRAVYKWLVHGGTAPPTVRAI